MSLILLLPHVYAFFLCLIQPWEYRVQRKALRDIEGQEEPSEDWIETALHQEYMKDFYEAPFFALIATVTATLVKQNLELTAVAFFGFLLAVVIANRIRVLVEPKDLEGRIFKLVRWEITGRMLVFSLKLLIVILSAFISLIA